MKAIVAILRADGEITKPYLCAEHAKSHKPESELVRMANTGGIECCLCAEDFKPWETFGGTDYPPPAPPSVPTLPGMAAPPPSMAPVPEMPEETAGDACVSFFPLNSFMVTALTGPMIGQTYEGPRFTRSACVIDPSRKAEFDKWIENEIRKRYGEGSTHG